MSTSTSVGTRDEKKKEHLDREIWGTGTPAEEREEERAIFGSNNNQILTSHLRENYEPRI
jgi:hypothetical protein